MNVVDSSAWLEYFGNGPAASYFARPIEDAKRLIIPTLAIFEVFKRVLQQRNEGDALRAVAVMKQGTVVDLDTPLALRAARLTVEHRLPMADSIILATARAFDATVWTLDADFQGLPSVQYRAREP